MEACCPNCGGWFPVESEEFLAATVDDDGNPAPVIVGAPFWWKASAGCPGCGSIVLVETECEFRRTA
jgi:hypothetical protein